MKNKIITVCIILAALLSFMSFAAVLTQMNSKGDEPEEVTTEAPELKSFIVTSEFEGGYYGTFYYREGMTWEEWIDSEYGSELFTIDGDVSFQGSFLNGSSGTKQADNGCLIPVDSLGIAHESDVIECSVYFI